MAFNTQRQSLALLFPSFVDQCSKDHQHQAGDPLSNRQMCKGPQNERGKRPDVRDNKRHLTNLAPPKKKRQPLTEIGNFLLGSASLEVVPALNNVLSGAQYVKELHLFYNKQQYVRRPRDYMRYQIKINPDMRAGLVRFLMAVHGELHRQPETLYLAVSIVDRFLSLCPVTCRELRIVGISSLLIATKYEEDWVPKVYKFLTVSGGEYSKKEVCIWERAVLDTLDWYLTIPTVYMFLVHFVKGAEADEKLEQMIYYYGELGLTQYSLILYSPSMVAAATVYAARRTLRRSPLWTAMLQQHTSYSESQLMDCAEIIIQAHLEDD